MSHHLFRIRRRPGPAGSRRPVGPAPDGLGFHRVSPSGQLPSQTPSLRPPHLL